ncbi:hypothetical protein [Flagellimonas amoyensis]|uniref:hypothetical protein n=1 Tax=Flagellimonas amoyensis TaxID=2169401 RepID=UPI000D36ACF4|nr:hypothetical protein [Allomuricauda amoyensis]
MNQFELYHKIKEIQSDPIREMAYYLADEKRIAITSFGLAWSNATAPWIYFDTVLDVEGLQSQFGLGENMEVHENLDPKSGLERGFVDQTTGEGLMGKI